jgi:hypothetical protein
MSQRNESLKSYSLRSPVAPLQRDRGNWKWSAICASLVTEAQGTVSPAEITDDESATAGVNLFLFLHDAPAIVQVDQVYAAVTDGTTTFSGYSCKPETLTGVNSVAFVTDANDAVVSAEDGEAIKGYTLTNDVQVAGYAVFAGTVQALSNQAHDANLEVCAFANSPVIEGRTEFGTDGETEAVPAILLESAYTQAIRDAGNLLTDSGGVVYEIVGLYSVATP